MNRKEERLRQARESLEEARLLAEERIGTKAVMANLYHAMMAGLFALLDITDLRRMSHAVVIERFEREYRGTTLADEAFLAVLHRAYDLTHECDCNHMPVPTDREIDETSRAAARFLAETERFLNNEVSKHESSAV